MNDVGPDITRCLPERKSGFFAAGNRFSAALGSLPLGGPTAGFVLHSSPSIRMLRGVNDSIQKLTREIGDFRDARDWAQFHGPKEMAVAIAAEAGELLQHFVWQDETQSLRRVDDRRDEIASEMADVAILLFEMADNCGVDLAAAMRAKLARNEERYPVTKARGSNRKYNEL